MTHHTRQMIVDAIGGAEHLTVRLAEGDVAWRAGQGPIVYNYGGPGLATYRRLGGHPYCAGFDPLAGDHDPRCEAVREGGDQCRLLAGDHLAHYWGEPDGPDL